MKYVPEELQNLERVLAAIYYCNFSVFQSAPDIWAIDQLFPIMPIHRLEEEPTVRATLADLTCDSDGAIDHFIDVEDVKHVLEVHPLRDGRAVLHRALPERRLPGDPGRSAQPLRRHQRRARPPRRGDEATTSRTSSRATRSPRCSTTCSTHPRRWSSACASRPSARCATNQITLAADAPLDAALRREPRQVHVPERRRRLEPAAEYGHVFAAPRLTE